MNWRGIRTLVAKDVNLYFKNRFFALVTVLALVAYAVLFFVMPASVDESIEIGVFAPSLPAGVAEALRGQGVELIEVASADELRESVASGDRAVGVLLPADLFEQLQSGQRPRIEVFFSSVFPTDFQGAYEAVLEDLALGLGGLPQDIEIATQVLGPDLAGRQIPPRERLLPLLAVIILLMETMGLASLISTEVEEGTLRALLVTPLRVRDLLVGKGVTGILLAFSQVALLMAVTGGLGRQPVLVLLALLLGAAMVTGLGFLMASVGRDMISVMSWGILAMLILMLPSLAVLLPGLVSNWVQVVPSHFLVDTVYRVANFGAGWGDVGINLIALLAFSLAFFWLGGAVLRRRFL